MSHSRFAWEVDRCKYAPFFIYRSQTFHNLDKVGPRNAKFLQFPKQAPQPLAVLASCLQGEKGVVRDKTRGKQIRVFI